MVREKLFKTQNETKLDIEKFFKTKLSNEEFRIIRDLASSDSEHSIEQFRFSPFDKYIYSLKRWGTKSGKIRNTPNTNVFSAFDYLPFPWDENDEATKKLYVLIQEEIDNRYPKLEIKRESIREHNKQNLKKDKKSSSWGGGPDPDLIIGLVVFVFLTWLIFGVIFGGGDLSPGGPKFFGHDGG